MNTQSGRLILAGLFWIAVVSAAPAQTWPQSDDEADGASHSSHRLLSGVGDLAGAEKQLAERLHHTQDMREIQDLVKPLLDDPKFKDMLQQKLKDLKPEEIENLKKTIQQNPQLLDDPKMHDIVKDLEKFKQGGNLADVPKETRDGVANWARDFIQEHKPADPSAGPPATCGPMDPMTQAPVPPGGTPIPPASSAPNRFAPPPEPSPSQNDWIHHDLLPGMEGLIKDIDHSPEGEALRTSVLQEMSKWDANTSTGFTDFVKSVLTPEQTSWLSNAKSPSGFNTGGWDGGAFVPTGPSFGGSSGGLMDAVVWIAALALLAVAAWMALALARRKAAQARAKPWTPGPWPVLPSQVSTRRDLILAFEHLAYLLIGPVARSLNHLDAARRIGRKEVVRPAAADRLAQLYEQARYAPPDEALAAQELTAARGDLAALAGAAA